MKYYIVLDAISNTYPKSFFAQPRTEYDKQTIMTAFRSQKTAKLFSEEIQAFHYARSQTKNGIPPKSSGRISPIIECELELSHAYEMKQVSCFALDGDPSVTKTNMVKMSVMYFEMPVNEIKNNNLTKVCFPKESIPDIDLTNRGLLCTIL